MATLVIDIIYLFFAFISIYFTILFFLLFAKQRKSFHKMPEMKSFPSLSIIIPAYNEANSIASTIRAVKNLQYPKKPEVIVVDDGSTDETFKISSVFNGIKVFRKKNGGKASALNFGLKHAKGELVACIDADGHPKQDALLKSVPFFTDSGVAAVTAAIYARSPQTVVERLQNIEYTMIGWARKLLEALDSIYVTPGPLSIYKTSILKSVGGFDEKNVTEDIEIAWRLLYNGYKIKMAPDAEVYTRAPVSMKNWWRQRMRWNIGGMQTTMKYKGALLKKSFGSLGTFILPFFSLSYILSIVGISFFFYILFKTFADFAQFSKYIIALGGNPTSYFNFIALSDIFAVFGTIMFVLSIIWVIFALTSMKKDIGGLKSIPYLLLYLSLYVTVFPLNLIHSSIRFLQGKHGWQLYSNVSK